VAKSTGSSTYKPKPGRGAGKVAEQYRHPEQTSPMRPDVGTQAQFRKKKPPKTYRYDSSLSPSLEWDGQNGSRELGEWLIGLIEQAVVPDARVFDKPQELRASDGRVVVTIRSLEEAVSHLKRLSAPFLNWAGKAERLSFDVPTLPLFVHERLPRYGRACLPAAEGGPAGGPRQARRCAAQPARGGAAERGSLARPGRFDFEAFCIHAAAARRFRAEHHCGVWTER
jgi:hypothetical protein